jgi:3,4-dihydroxy 2-butanone 4-phosphate synthase/GTP cyclohydrolase II
MPGSVAEAAIDELARGRPVVLLDGEAGGDLVVAAELITADAINFMAREGRGLIRLALSPGRCAELELTLMPVRNPSGLASSFMVSIEAADGVTTGISAADRARTIKVAASRRTSPDQLRRPGHVVPIRTHEGGVLEQAAPAEAAVDLVRAASLVPAAAMCEVLADDGALARGRELARYCRRHRLPAVSVADVVAYRQRVARRQAHGSRVEPRTVRA